jgi:hypothetical protein
MKKSSSALAKQFVLKTRVERRKIGQNELMTALWPIHLIGSNGALMSHSILHSRYSTWIFIAYGVFVLVLVFSVMTYLRKRQQRQFDAPVTPRLSPRSLTQRPKPKRIVPKPVPPDPMEGRVTFQTSKTEIFSLPEAKPLNDGAQPVAPSEPVAAPQDSAPAALPTQNVPPPLPISEAPTIEESVPIELHIEDEKTPTGGSQNQAN